MLNKHLHTRDKIVELGRNQIQQIGYHAFNYKQIATVLEIKNAAIHHYYPSKEDLGVAVVKKDHEEFEQMKMKMESASSTPHEKVEALLNNYAGYFKEGKLCVIGTFEAAANDIPEKIKTATIDYLDDVFNWLKDTMQSGLDNGNFHFKQTAAELAELWLAVLPGALMKGRLRGKKAFETLIQQLKNSLAV